MIELIIRQTPHDVRETAWGFGALESTYSGKQLPAALDSILDGMTEIRASAELAEALSTRDELCELAAQVAVVRKLQRELDNRDATDADHAILNGLRRSANPWVHREAGNLLMIIADERDQAAAHDGEEAPEKRYRLRCGAIVVIPKASEWIAPIKFVDVSQADFGSRRKWEVDEEACLLPYRDANPLNWKGGVHGDGLDIIEEVAA